jgi:hypothetical protein
VIGLDTGSARRSQQTAAALRSADRKIQAALRAGLAQATQPLAAEVRSALRANLPKRGGLNQWAADRVVTRVTHAGAGARVADAVTVAMPGHDLRALERGTIKHPVYGRGRYVDQRLPKTGAVTDVIRGPVAQRARTRIAAELTSVASQIARDAT